MDELVKPAAVPQAWLDALADGEADLAASRSSPWPEARKRLVALQERLKERAARQA